MKQFIGIKSDQSAFSLVELMIVVGIIGVLATLALPRFKQFQAKAKLAEASGNLAHIYTLEQSYSLDNNQFGTFTDTGAILGAPTGCDEGTAAANQIGFKIEPCAGGPVPRFRYGVQAVTSSTFVANAAVGDMANNRICPGNGQFHLKLNQGNIASYTLAAATNALVGTNGIVPINSACAN